MEVKRVLVIEDNPDDELLTRRSLRKSGVPIEEVVIHDGVAAIAYFTTVTREAAPDLVLLDLKMPKINGLEVLEHIRANETTRYLPVVMFTSSNEANDICVAYELGVNSYVRKPVDFHLFSTAVQQICLYWLTLNVTLPR
jgi:CheY-like chemotaxis protein